MKRENDADPRSPLWSGGRQVDVREEIGPALCDNPARCDLVDTQGPSADPFGLR